MFLLSLSAFASIARVSSRVCEHWRFSLSLFWTFFFLSFFHLFFFPFFFFNVLRFGVFGVSAGVVGSAYEMFFSKEKGFSDFLRIFFFFFFFLFFVFFFVFFFFFFPVLSTFSGMKLIRKNVDQFGAGDITLKPMSSEDMWSAYNLIAAGDRVTCATFRKMQKVSTTGTTSNNRVKMTLTVVVTKVDFEPKAGKLRVSGQVTDHAQIKQGSFHTLELEAPRKFTIHKELWDSVALQMVEEACAEKSSADLAAVVLEMGLANVCLVTKNMTVTKAKIELSVPRKRAGSTQHEKQRDKFFEYVVQALLQHIDWNVVKAVIVASPGFVKVS